MKYCLLLIIMIPNLVFSNMTTDQVVKKVQRSIVKHHLTSVKLSCLHFFIEEDDTNYFITIREHHNKQCGGDPDTSPRLFTYEVNKSNGKMRVDDQIWTGESRDID